MLAVTFTVAEYTDKKNRKQENFRMGNRAELRVVLTDGYQSVAYKPAPAMAWIHGGVSVKRYSMDFESKDELRIPVVVTSKIEGKPR